MEITDFKQHGTAPSAKQLVVVDSDLQAYQSLVASAESGELKLTLTSSGRTALRLLPSFVDAVWLVNVQLPDMSGFDLLEMLQSLQHSLRVAMIDDQYDPNREQQALRYRAMQYVCKPMHPAWVDAWHGDAAGLSTNSAFANQSKPHQPHSPRASPAKTKVTRT